MPDLSPIQGDPPPRATLQRPVAHRNLPRWAVRDGLGEKLIVLLAGLFATVFALRIVGHVDKFLLMWPVTGLVLALVLPSWAKGRQKRLSMMLSAATGVLIGGVAVGQPIWLAASLGALTCLDLLIAGAILSPYVQRFDDLKQRRNMFRFVIASFLAPVISGVFGALPVSLFLKEQYLETAAMSILANSLGMAVVLPAALFFLSGEYRSLRKLAPYARRACVSGIPFIAIAALVFWQNRGPFLFVVFPAMIAVLLAMGLEGAVLTSITLSIIGWIATSHGHGPIMLMQGATPEFRLLVLQIFIWVSIATALPVGAMLDERKRAERSAAESQAIYEILMQHTEDTIVLSTVHGVRRYVSPGITKLTGFTQAEYIALNRDDTVHPDDRDLVPMLTTSMDQGKREHTVRYRILHKDGTFTWVEAIVRAYGSPDIAGYVGTVRDISILKETEDGWQRELDVLSEEKLRLAKLAQIDPLTGLLNRRGLDEMLLQHKNLGREKMACLMIDVDYFKLYNDTYGHQAGDACLLAIAGALRGQASRENDLVARLGGEEFAIFLPAAEIAGALRIADQVRNALSSIAIKHLASPLGIVTVSIGISAKTGRDHMDLNLLLAQADRSLYASKRAGRNRVTAFEDKLQAIPA